MAGGFTVAKCQSILDAEFPTTGDATYVGYSQNGTSESANIARHAVGATNWSAATAATPSVKANAAQFTSGAATGAATLTHFALMTSGGTLITEWTALTTSRTLASGDFMQWAAGALQVTLD